ncbi:hypothetical protein D3C85_1915290 [compost metagenome]
MRHARNITVKDTTFEVEQADARPAVVMDSVQGAVIDGLRSSLAPRSAVRAVRSRDIQTGDISRLA